MRRFLLLVLACGLLAAAPSIGPREIVKQNPQAGQVLAVPFIAQDRYQCGPASLAMVLQYHGRDADQDQIAQRFETEALAGTFTVDLLIAATDAGMEAHWLSADLARLRAEIDQGLPPIVFLNLQINPLPARHFAVAVGYVTYKKQDYIVLHSGPDPYLMVPVRKFERQWKRTKNLMMTVEPKVQTDKSKETK